MGLPQKDNKMKPNEEVRNTLLRQKENIVGQINKLQEDLKAIDRVLNLPIAEQLEVPHGEKEPLMHEKTKKQGKMKMAEFVRGLFEEDPKRIWSPTEITVEIQKMMDLGKVESVSPALRVTHRVINAFKKNKTIERVLVGSSKSPKYKKKQ